MRRKFKRETVETPQKEVSPLLQDANLDFANGKYISAAEKFEKLAQTAEDQNSRRSYIYYLQAGHAYVLARQELLGLPSFRRGLQLIAERKQFQKLHMAGERVLSALNARNLKDEVKEIQAWLKRTLTEVPTTIWSEKQSSLPAFCPACGASIHTDDVDWLNQNVAECGYCGNAVN